MAQYRTGAFQTGRQYISDPRVGENVAMRQQRLAEQKNQQSQENRSQARRDTERDAMRRMGMWGIEQGLAQQQQGVANTRYDEGVQRKVDRDAWEREFSLDEQASKVENLQAIRDVERDRFDQSVTRYGEERDLEAERYQAESALEAGRYGQEQGEDQRRRKIQEDQAAWQQYQQTGVWPEWNTPNMGPSQNPASATGGQQDPTQMFNGGLQPGVQPAFVQMRQRAEQAREQEASRATEDRRREQQIQDQKYQESQLEAARKAEKHRQAMADAAGKASGDYGGEGGVGGTRRSSSGGSRRRSGGGAFSVDPGTAVGEEAAWLNSDKTPLGKFLNGGEIERVEPVKRDMVARYAQIQSPAAAQFSYEQIKSQLEGMAANDLVSRDDEAAEALRADLLQANARGYQQAAKRLGIPQETVEEATAAPPQAPPPAGTFRMGAAPAPADGGKVYLGDAPQDFSPERDQAGEQASATARARSVPEGFGGTRKQPGYYEQLQDLVNKGHKFPESTLQDLENQQQQAPGADPNWFPSPVQASSRPAGQGPGLGGPLTGVPMGPPGQTPQWSDAEWWASQQGQQQGVPFGDIYDQALAAQEADNQPPPVNERQPEPYGPQGVPRELQDLPGMGGPQLQNPIERAQLNKTMRMRDERRASDRTFASKGRAAAAQAADTDQVADDYFWDPLFSGAQKWRDTNTRDLRDTTIAGDQDLGRVLRGHADQAGAWAQGLLDSGGEALGRAHDAYIPERDLEAEAYGDRATDMKRRLDRVTAEREAPGQVAAQLAGDRAAAREGVEGRRQAAEAEAYGARATDMKRRLDRVTAEREAPAQEERRRQAAEAASYGDRATDMKRRRELAEDARSAQRQDDARVAKEDKATRKRAAARKKKEEETNERLRRVLVERYHKQMGL